MSSVKQGRSIDLIMYMDLPERMWPELYYFFGRIVRSGFLGDESEWFQMVSQEVLSEIILPFTPKQGPSFSSSSLLFSSLLSPPLLLFLLPSSLFLSLLPLEILFVHCMSYALTEPTVVFTPLPSALLFSHNPCEPVTLWQRKKVTLCLTRLIFLARARSWKNETQIHKQEVAFRSPESSYDYPWLFSTA